MPENEANPNDRVAKLIERWCDRRALNALRIVLPVWPSFGLTDGWGDLWAGLRHARAMCRDDLKVHGEYEEVSSIIAQLSEALYPGQAEDSLEDQASTIIASIFGGPSAQ